MKDKPVILVVDDQPQNIELLEAYLVPHGYEIIGVSNGEDALQKLADSQIDLILLDIVMPGMDGFEVTRRVRQSNTVPIILVSVSREEDDREKGIEAGCDDFVSKPFDKTVLLARVRSLLRETFRHSRNRPVTVMNSRPNTFSNREMEFHGKALAPGIVIGRAYLLKKVDLQQFQNDKRTVDLVSSELARLDLAISKSKEQISRFMSKIPRPVADQSSQMFEAELLILNDPAFILSVKEIIERTSLHGETVLAEEIARLRDKASSNSDNFAGKNLIFMQDLYYRVLYNMLPANEGRISSILKVPPGSILVADRLTPVEVAVVPVDRVVGIIVEESSYHSHASIIAQALGVPVLICVPGIGSIADEWTDVLIDAYRGHAILNPSDATIEECFDRERRTLAEAKLAAPSGDATVVHSADGIAIHLLCNAGNLANVIRAHKQGIKEIGLFRSEIGYLANTVLFSDSQEAAYYAGIFGVEGIDSVTVRLLDIGGDKLPVYMQMTEETDPQLGCRGIRFLLAHRDLMRKQIRAILMARQARDVRLMLPFVTTVDDLTKSREIIDEVLTELKIPGDSLKVGIMIEVPSVALSIERFLPRVDFVSLGTNDLIQYFFAVNRDQDELQNYNRFAHPVFLKVLGELISTCQGHGTHLTICGEMASDPTGCNLLAALGATHFSVQPDAIPLVRSAISKCKVAAVREALPDLFDSDSADQVELKLQAIGI